MNNQQRDYIASFLGINTSNDYILADLEFDNADEFISFMKKNISHIDLSYKNPLQKLVILKNMFSLQKHQEKLGRAKDLSLEVTKKVKQIAPLVSRSDFKMCKYSEFFIDKKRLFEKWEIKLLEKIGNPKQVVKLQRRTSGNDDLNDKLLELITFKATQPQLANKKDIKQLVQKGEYYKSLNKLTNSYKNT